jgi:phosphate/sulfate permease
MKTIFDYFRGKTELMVGTIALAGYLVAWFVCVIFNIVPFPLIYIIKPVFGLFSATIITTVVWFIFDKGMRVYKSYIDPDDLVADKELTKWQKTKLSFWFFVLYCVIAAYSASQL